MGLIVKSNGDKKVTFLGTPIEVYDGVYVRLEIGIKPDGKSISATAYTYYDKNSFLRGEIMQTSITGASFEDILPDDKEATIANIIDLARIKFEQYGFLVTVVDLE